MPDDEQIYVVPPPPDDGENLFHCLKMIDDCLDPNTTDVKFEPPICAQLTFRGFTCRVSKFFDDYGDDLVDDQDKPYRVTVEYPATEGYLRQRASLKAGTWGQVVDALMQLLCPTVIVDRPSSEHGMNKHLVGSEDRWVVVSGRELADRIDQKGGGPTNGSH